MSSPYNNFIVNNVAAIPVQQPYVNSNVEVGYFRSPITSAIGGWYSMNTVVSTTNGIATLGTGNTVGGNTIYGLKILNAGIYKIHLSLFPVNGSSRGFQMKINFGTVLQNNNPTSNTVNAFGGKGNSNNLGYGMYTFDNNYNYTYPGIISWLGNGYNNVNTTNSGFTIAAGELNFSYNADASSGSGLIFAGICTTQITFILNGDRTIYLNVSASESGVVMGNCYFTLELISSIPQYFIYTWTPNNIGAFNWQAIASSSSGQYLAAVVNSGYIYTSSNSGTSWIQQNGPPSVTWQSIASSEDGTRLAAVSTALVISSVTYVYVYTGYYNGSSWDWTSQTSNFPGVSWGGIASDETGTILAAAGNSSVVDSGAGGIYRGVFDGSIWTWTKINSLAANWRSITSSDDGTKLAALVNGGGIYTGVYNGSTWTWTQQTTNLPVTANWRSITSSKDGTRLAALVYGGSIYTGYDDGSGFVWTIQTNTSVPVTANWTSITSSYDGTRLAATSYGGYIYTATLTNNVYTWSLPTSPILNWIAIASNETGEKLAAVVTNGSNMYIGTLISNNTSIKPYNNFGVNDLAIPPIRQPYVNSIVEVGYFSPSNTVGNTWYSMNTNLITNNGIATTASVTAQTNGSPSSPNQYVTGLKIKNAGIYKITLSVFPALTNANINGNISYNFGYVPQWTTGQTYAINAFGGAGSSSGGFGLYTFDNNLNKNIPGIISWLPTGFATTVGFTKISATNELNYTYNYNTSGQATGSNYYIANGICTSEMTFFVTEQQNIFLNICGGNTLTMSNCYFTLELISTQQPLI